MIRVIALVVVTALVPAIARAEEDAKAHYKRGFAAYGLGHYADAAREYEKAFELNPDGALLYDAAQAHRLANNNKRALELYENYLRLFGDKAKNRDEVLRKIEEIKADQAKKPAAPATPTTPTVMPSPGPSPLTGDAANLFARPAEAHASAPQYAGHCPTREDITATVYPKGPAPVTITYRFSRSDRSHGRDMQITLPGGTEPVNLPGASWMVSGAPGAHTERWMQLEILQPVAMTSNQARFVVDCQ
jgi:tetratricopeptide (TPR) repeat protein